MTIWSMRASLGELQLMTAPTPITDARYPSRLTVLEYICVTSVCASRDRDDRRTRDRVRTSSFENVLQNERLGRILSRIDGGAATSHYLACYSTVKEAAV